jgi:phosphoglycerate dehydrogenase-like enzyme
MPVVGPTVIDFRLGITRDILGAENRIGWGDIGLALLDAEPSITVEILPRREEVLSPEQVGNYDALLVLGAQVRASSLSDPRRLKLLARFGVGYDSVDIEACTAAGVAVTITPDGVRRPLAAAAMTLILSVSHNVVAKDGLVRSGRWHERMEHMGRSVHGATLGLVGVGNVGREIVPLARAFGMSCIGCDPYADPAQMAAAGVTAVGLEELLHRADVVCVVCPLTEETRHLIGEAQLALMKPGAILVNVARGAIVDQAALTRALQSGTIRAAGLDVFEEEPPQPADPLLALGNVVLSPHSLCWTDELALGVGTSALANVVALSHRRPLNYVVNPAALDHARLKAWFEKGRER